MLRRGGVKRWGELRLHIDFSLEVTLMQQESDTTCGWIGVSTRRERKRWIGREIPENIFSSEGNYVMGNAHAKKYSISTGMNIWQDGFTLQVWNATTVYAAFSVGGVDAKDDVTIPFRLWRVEPLADLRWLKWAGCMRQDIVSISEPRHYGVL